MAHPHARTHEDPSRTTSRALALVALAALAANAVAAPDSGVARAVAACASVLIAVVAWLAARGRDGGDARSVALLTAIVAALSATGLVWQATMAIALLAHHGFTRFGRSLPRGRDTFARGRVPGLATAVVGGVTPIALVGWLLLFRPDLGDVLPPAVQRLPLYVLFAGAASFAIVNAALEEAIWRGVLQDRLTALFGVLPAIALQALSFGLQHAHGVPRGPVGVALAAIWAVMLGVLRWRAAGILAPLLAHVVADATIAAIMFATAHPAS